MTASELKPGVRVKLIAGRYTGRTGVYRRPMSCGRFHIVDLGNGLATLVLVHWLQIISAEKQNASLRG